MLICEFGRPFHEPVTAKLLDDHLVGLYLRTGTSDVVSAAACIPRRGFWSRAPACFCPSARIPSAESFCVRSSAAVKGCRPLAGVVELHPVFVLEDQAMAAVAVGDELGFMSRFHLLDDVLHGQVGHSLRNLGFELERRGCSLDLVANLQRGHLRYALFCQLIQVGLRVSVEFFGVLQLGLLCSQLSRKVAGAPGLQLLSQRIALARQRGDFLLELIGLIGSALDLAGRALEVVVGLFPLLLGNPGRCQDVGIVVAVQLTDPVGYYGVLVVARKRFDQVDLFVGEPGKGFSPEAFLW